MCAFDATNTLDIYLVLFKALRDGGESDLLQTFRAQSLSSYQSSMD